MRALEAAYIIAASVFGYPPTHVVVVKVHATGECWTTWHRAHDFDGDTYTPKTLNVEELSESMLLRVPTGRLTIASLEGVVQADAKAGIYRGSRVTIRFLWLYGDDFLPTGWGGTYRIDREQASGNDVTFFLCSSDAAVGVTAPLYTTTEAGCQADFRGRGCYYRPALTEGKPFPTTQLANECDKTLDTPLGCLSHFLDIEAAKGARYTGATGQQRMRLPVPFRAFPGSLVRWITSG